MFRKKKPIAMFLALLAIICTYQYFSVQPAFLGLSQNQTLPVIMYHNISPKESMLGKFIISPTQFENDLIYLKENGYNTVSMDELIDYVYNDADLPENPILLTFDDGYESFYVYAYPLLQKHGMKAVMNVLGSYSDIASREDFHNLDYSHLSWTQINELSKSEFVEIQNHTYDMHKISPRKGCSKKYGESVNEYNKVLKDDLSKLQTLVTNYTAKTPTTFAYPFGCMCSESETILKDIGFKATLSCTEKLNTISSDPDSLYCLGRFNRAHGESSSTFFKRVLNNK